MNVWKCELIFPTDWNTDFKPFLPAENTSVLIILSTAVDYEKN